MPEKGHSPRLGDVVFFGIAAGNANLPEASIRSSTNCVSNYNSMPTSPMGA